MKERRAQYEALKPRTNWSPALSIVCNQIREPRYLLANEYHTYHLIIYD